MESCTATHAYLEYHPTATLLAFRYGPRLGALDEMARTTDDYVQELRLKAITTANRFQKLNGFCLPAERRYTYKSLWNRARSWKRKRFQRALREVPLLDSMERASGTYQIEGQLVAREVVRVLHSVLTADDRELLARLVQSDGIVSKAWIPETDGSLRTFERRVAQVRELAKNLMDS